MLNFSRTHKLLLAFSLSLPTLSFAKEDVLKYLDKESFSAEKDFNPAPTVDSKLTIKDLEIILKYQGNRTEEDCARAKSEVAVSVETFFGRPYGTLTDEQSKYLTPFLEKVLKDAKYFVRVAKEFYKRPRPYVSFPQITPCVDKEMSLSYPSGHSTIAFVWGDLLEEVFPESKTLIHNRAQQIAADRVIGGVHYPSDIAESRAFATKFVTKIKTSAEFKKDFKEVKDNFAEDRP